MATLKRLLRDTIPNRMWIGSKDEVLALVKVSREIQDRSRRAALELFSESEAERRDRFLRFKTLSKSEANAAWAIESARQNAEVSESISLTMEVTLKTYAERITGAPEDLLDALDSPEEVTSLRLDMGTEHPRYDLPPHSGFRIVMDKVGALTVIWGLSRDWIDVVKPQLSHALKRQQPWYSWFRHAALTFLIPYMLVVLPYLLISAIVRQAGVETNLAADIVIPLCAALAGALFGFFGWPRLVPNFQLLRDGRNPRAAIAIGAISWMAAAIIIPALFLLLGAQ